METTKKRKLKVMDKSHFQRGHGFMLRAPADRNQAS